MTIPDYISPIVGYRVWQWGPGGLRSLNGERWFPGRPLRAVCRAAVCRKGITRAEVTGHGHFAPQCDCTCGIYSANCFDHLARTGYGGYGIYGEVYLWGAVVEHQLGWRAQCAYPKNLFLPPSMMPFSIRKLESRLGSLISYGAGIFIADPSGNVCIWSREHGYDPVGVARLIETGQKYYIRSRQERTIKEGDRVALLGRGMAMVEQTENQYVQVVLSNRFRLRIAREQIRWVRRNLRWESSVPEPLGLGVRDRDLHTRSEDRGQKWSR
jgi:hypothetical protein